MGDDRVGYWQRRLHEERDRAQSCKNEIVAKIHERMAAEYASLLNDEQVPDLKIVQA
jgi:hypothetical protein